jgi:hypothetical protein
MSLEEKLQEIKKRCEDATEGPWYYVDGDYSGGLELSTKPEDLKWCENDDQRFIVHARTDVPMLLEMVEWLLKYNKLDVEDGNVIVNQELEKIAEKYK